MRALLHYRAPGTPPVGVWWLPKGSRKRPKAFYVDEDYRLDGARAIYGTDHNGDPLSLADWHAVCDRLTNTAHPALVFTDHETTSPESLLVPGAAL